LRDRKTGTLFAGLEPARTDDSFFIKAAKRKRQPIFICLAALSILLSENLVIVGFRYSTCAAAQNLWAFGHWQ
jgi:hypothetical protein